MFLFRPFGSGGSGVKLYSVFTSGDFLVHGEVRRRNIMKAGLVVWLKEVRVSVMLRDLLGVPGSASVVCRWGRHHRKFRVLHLRVKTQGLALTGCAWQ